MELHERISSGPKPSQEQEPFAELKNKVHMMVISELGPQLFNVAIDPNELRSRVTADIRRHLNDEAGLAREDRDRLTAEILDDILGYGPLERLIADDSITEIMCNGSQDVWIERGGKLYETTVRFTDESHLRRIINKIVSQTGRRIDEASPMVDARLPDGSRVNAIIPPLAITGPSLTIRKFSKDPLTIDDLVSYGTLSHQAAAFLEACVSGKLNILVSGGTGTGKTTLLNVLSSFIPEDERILTIENAAELQLQQRHVVTLESRPANIEGRGEVGIRELVVNALRMRPDRIIVGECRSGEALDMLQAMNTGHDGSLTTVHANNPRDAIGRLEVMVGMANSNMGVRSMRQQISSAVDMFVQVSRFSDGTRRITHITECVGMEGDLITMQDIFVFEKTGLTESGRVTGRFRATGIRPKFYERLRTCGIQLPASLFQ